MRIIATLLATMALALPLFAETNVNRVVLSGTLLRATPNDFRRYQLDIGRAGGGNERILLSGDVLHSFDETLVKGGGIPHVRISGQFKTEYKQATGVDQPTMGGWLVWFEVEEARIDLDSVRPKRPKEDVGEPAAGALRHRNGEAQR